MLPARVGKHRMQAYFPFPSPFWCSIKVDFLLCHFCKPFCREHAQNNLLLGCWYFNLTAGHVSGEGLLPVLPRRRICAPRPPPDVRTGEPTGFLSNHWLDIICKGLGRGRLRGSSCGERSVLCNHQCGDHTKPDVGRVPRGEHGTLWSRILCGPVQPQVWCSSNRYNHQPKRWSAAFNVFHLSFQIDASKKNPWWERDVAVPKTSPSNHSPVFRSIFESYLCLTHPF